MARKIPRPLAAGMIYLNLINLISKADFDEIYFSIVDIAMSPIVMTKVMAPIIARIIP
ncbi:MAG: hypothetical protein ACI9MF_002566, partial [Gammaproteobacteria bacterium]